MFEISSYVKTLKMKTVFVFGFFAALVVSALVLLLSGNVAPAAIRSMAALNPGIRLGTGPVQEILQSVQEQRPAAWGTFYYTLGVTAFFVPVGLYFTVQNPTNRNIFLCLFGLTALYFASSLVRLTLILAPAVSLLVALALVRLLNPFITILKEHPIPRRRMRFETHVGKEFSGAFILVILLVLTFTFVIPSPATAFPRFLDQAYSPTTINAASLPIRPNAPVNDWLDALKWMRFNLPPSPPYGPTVVAAWWDYGYWIILYANRTTLCDNGTTNVTQIAQVGLMFMSDETQAITILKRYNVTDVVVFATFDSSGAWEGYGDEGKWRWMARIAGLNDNSYGNYSLGVNQLANSTEVPNALGMNTTIYKLMTYGMETTLSKNITVQFTLNSEGQPYFEEAYFSETPATVQNVLQSCGLVPLVCVYKVNYG
jgi:dolichyl-diphosphooligosaccharide--protein glycosyltransferase